MPWVLVVAWGCATLLCSSSSSAFLLLRGPSSTRIEQSTTTLPCPHGWININELGHHRNDIRTWKSVTRPSLRAGLSSSSSNVAESTALEHHPNDNDQDGDNGDSLDDDLLSHSVQALGWDNAVHQSLRDCLNEAGFYDNNHTSHSSSSFETLVALCRDYAPSDIAHMLMNDFHIGPALRAHQLRATIVQAWRLQQEWQKDPQQQKQPQQPSPPPNNHRSPPSTLASGEQDADRSFHESETDGSARNDTTSRNNDSAVDPTPLPQRPLYKSVQVNTAAVRRKQNKSNVSYGLLDDSAMRHPLLAHDLDKFWEFMTKPTPLAQEEPLRPATATVYLRHAKLYLGWYLSHRTPDLLGDQTPTNDAALSLSSVFSSPDAGAAAPLIDFVLWLRSERSISASYEANVLRGLSKLVKFRFAHCSTAPPSSATHAYDDVPLVLELRKLHRVANRQQRLSPRSSNEQRKWISWPEYLGVVEACRVHALQLLQASARQTPINPESVTSQDRAIAVALQRYLVLAIFANVPDRQRTVRELEVGRTLIWDDASMCWCIRHAPQDYKTGKTYGERPPLQLPASLSEVLSAFHQHWRQCLRPSGAALFVQPRTGKSLTSDSVYQLVSRACYEHTGRRTNPHLLRDMIVTHVRDASQASEKELEALALFMGHSLHMQRTSYDRRTLTRKVAPAVQLLEAVNREGSPQSLSQLPPIQ